MVPESSNELTGSQEPERVLVGTYEDIFGAVIQPVMWVRDGTRHIDFPWVQFYLPQHLPIAYFWTFMTTDVFGKEWLGRDGAQAAKPDHLVHKWFADLTAQWLEDREKSKEQGKLRTDGTFDAIPRRTTEAVHRLGYECFVLAARTVKLEHVYNDLRLSDKFLSARFEVAIGAFLCVAGFEVEYLKPNNSQKTPDIKATNRWLDKPLHVEVKRKRRNQSEHGGPINAAGEWRLRIRDRIKDALLQLEKFDRPWVVCIDLDLGFPMPDPSDEVALKKFFDAIVYESEEVSVQLEAEKPGFPKHVPDVLVLVQVPYNDDGAYEPGRSYQFLFSVHEDSLFAEQFQKIVGRLQAATAQFNHIPKYWDHLAKETKGP